MRKRKLVEYTLSYVPKYRGQRGRDKKPRKMNINSYYNLKPNWQIEDIE